MLWMLTDQYERVIVRATTEAEARQIACGPSKDDARLFPHWLDRQRTTCEPLSVDGLPQKILAMDIA